MDHIKNAKLQLYFERLSLGGYRECNGGAGHGEKGTFEGRAKVTTAVQMRDDWALAVWLERLGWIQSELEVPKQDYDWMHGREKRGAKVKKKSRFLVWPMVQTVV